LVNQQASMRHTLYIVFLTSSISLMSLKSRGTYQVWSVK